MKVLLIQVQYLSLNQYLTNKFTKINKFFTGKSKATDYKIGGFDGVTPFISIEPERNCECTKA